MSRRLRSSPGWVPIWIRRRIGLQLIIGSTVIFGVVLALFQMHSIAQDRDAIFAQLDREGVTLARTVSASCVEALLVEDYPVLETNLRLLVEKAAHVESALIERADGKVVAAYPEVSPSLVGGSGAETSRIYEAAVRIDIEGEELGRVRLEISTAPTAVLLETRVTRLARDVTLAFLTLSVLLAYLIRRMVGKRLQQLAEFAERVGDGELDRSLAVQGVDELAQLGETLETMRTKLEASDESLRGARDQAEAANAAKSSFLANMSHEIRTPLTAILGFNEIVLDSSSSSEERENSAATIRRNGEHLLTLINDILDFSKIDAGEFTVDPRPMEVPGLIQSVIDLMEVRAVEAGTPIDVEWRTDLPRVIECDDTRLRQILINLLGNAIKFANGKPVRLEVSLIEPDQLRFDVVDRGIGMTPVQAARLFQPFTQADERLTRVFGGTGLGLTISRKLAEMLGGFCDLVETRVGGGSRFRVHVQTGDLDGVEFVPAENATVGAQCVSARAQKGDSPGAIDRRAKGASETSWAVGAPPRVLLAEDGPDNQRLFTHFLKNLPIELTLVENGQLEVEAVQAALDEGQPFDLVLTDISMPILDGYGAMQKLRKLGFDGPIVAVTANAMPADRERCFACGANDFLSKPVKKKDLVAMVERFVLPVAERG